MLRILQHRKVAPWATFFVLLLHVIHVPHEESLGWLDGLHADKWVHAMMFSGITFLWILYPWKLNFPFYYLPIAMILYAGLLEVIQGALTADRSADIWDWIVDFLAIAMVSYFRPLILTRFSA